MGVGERDGLKRTRGVQVGHLRHDVGGGSADVGHGRRRCAASCRSVDLDDERMVRDRNHDLADIGVGGDRRAALQRVIDVDQVVDAAQVDGNRRRRIRDLGVGGVVPDLGFRPDHQLIGAVALAENHAVAARRHVVERIVQRGSRRVAALAVVAQDRRQIVDRVRRELRCSVAVEQTPVRFGICGVVARRGVQQLIEISGADAVLVGIDQRVQDRFRLHVLAGADIRRVALGRIAGLGDHDRFAAGDRRGVTEQLLEGGFGCQAGADIGVRVGVVGRPRHVSEVGVIGRVVVADRQIVDGDVLKRGVGLDGAVVDSLELRRSRDARTPIIAEPLDVDLVQAFQRDDASGMAGHELLYGIQIRLERSRAAGRNARRNHEVEFVTVFRKSLDDRLRFRARGESAPQFRHPEIFEIVLDEGEVVVGAPGISNVNIDADGTDKGARRQDRLIW